MAIHPTAVVYDGAKIGKNVVIGPYCIVEDNVVIGDNCYLDAHVKIARYTTIGDGCRIYYGALVGEEPQDHRFYKGIVSYTEIGSNTVIREYVNIHRPPFEGVKTVIGSHSLLMAFVHVAHDVVIGDRVTIANHTALSGHVEVEDGAVISGYILVHQFCRIGALSMVGPSSKIRQDIPPFCLLGEGSKIYGPNTVGLRRAGIPQKGRSAIKNAIKTFFFNGLNTTNAVEEIRKKDVTPEVEHFLDFVKSSKRGVTPSVSDPLGFDPEDF